MLRVFSKVMTEEWSQELKVAFHQFYPIGLLEE